MRKMPYAEFVAFVLETGNHTKFSEFLEEEAGGWTLTRDVLDDLVRWQQGISAGAQSSKSTDGKINHKALVRMFEGVASSVGQNMPLSNQKKIHSAATRPLCNN